MIMFLLQVHVGHCVGRGSVGVLSEPSQHAKTERRVSAASVDGK